MDVGVADLRPAPTRLVRVTMPLDRQGKALLQGQRQDIVTRFHRLGPAIIPPDVLRILKQRHQQVVVRLQARNRIPIRDQLIPGEPAEHRERRLEQGGSAVFEGVPPVPLAKQPNRPRHLHPRGVAPHRLGTRPEEVRHEDVRRHRAGISLVEPHRLGGDRGVCPQELVDADGTVRWRPVRAQVRHALARIHRLLVGRCQEALRRVAAERIAGQRLPAKPVAGAGGAIANAIPAAIARPDRGVASGADRDRAGLVGQDKVLGGAHVGSSHRKALVHRRGPIQVNPDVRIGHNFVQRPAPRQPAPFHQRHRPPVIEAQGVHRNDSAAEVSILRRLE